MSTSLLSLYLPTRAILRRGVLLAGLVGLIFLGGVSVGHAMSDQADSVSRSILALDSARNTAVKELESTTLSAGEISDCQDFVAYLNTQIFNYCRELEQLGALAQLADLPCPSAVMSGGGEGEQSMAQKQQASTAHGMEGKESGAGTAASLEDLFLGSLGEFDDMLLKEEEQMAARIPSQRESGMSDRQSAEAKAGGSGSEGEAGSGESETSAGVEGTSGAAAADVDGQMAASETPSHQNVRKTAGSKQAGAGAPDGRRPPPEDDDIVARQLREAAEKEPDPELKKKLWEEYWKYKGVKPDNG